MMNAWTFSLDDPTTVEPPWEIVTLPLSKSIEELFPGKYPSRYWEGFLDVLGTGAVRCDFIQVVNRSKELSASRRYEKLIPFI